MLYYIGLFIVLCSTEYILGHFNVRARKRIFLFLSFLLLTIIAGFRDYSVGTDTLQFVNSFKTFANCGFEVVNFNQIYEPGFMLYMVILSKVTSNPRFFILVTYIIINFAIIKFIGDHSKDYFLSVIIYIFSCQFFVSLTLIRQFLAISVVFLSMNYLLQGKYIRFAIIVLFSSMFHYFSMLFLILIPIKIIFKLNRPLLIIIAILFAVLFAFLPQIMMFLITHIKNYNDYIDYLHNLGEDVSSFHFPAMILVVIALLTPYILNIKRDYYKTDLIVYRGYNYGFLNIVYLMLSCLILLSARFGLFTRVYYYFTPFIVLIPNLFDFKKNKDWRVYIVLLCFAIFLVSMITNHGVYETQVYKFGGF